MNIGRAVRAGRVKKKKGQYRTGQEKKSQQGYISPISGKAPTEAIYIKNCVVGDLVDVITCAKFQNEIFMGYDYAGGRIFHFPIDFCEWALQQCSATALPVILLVSYQNGSTDQVEFRREGYFRGVDQWIVGGVLIS